MRASGWCRAVCLAALAPLVLAACAETKLAVHVAKEMRGDDARRGPVTPQGGVYKVGKPYQVAGIWYYPKVNPDYDETGIASWYGDPFHGRAAAMHSISTCAPSARPLAASAERAGGSSGKYIR